MSQVISHPAAFGIVVANAHRADVRAPAAAMWPRRGWRANDTSRQRRKSSADVRRAPGGVLLLTAEDVGAADPIGRHLPKFEVLEFVAGPAHAIPDDRRRRVDRPPETQSKQAQPPPDLKGMAIRPRVGLAAGKGARLGPRQTIAALQDTPLGRTRLWSGRLSPDVPTHSRASACDLPGPDCRRRDRLRRLPESTCSAPHTDTGLARGRAAGPAGRDPQAVPGSRALRCCAKDLGQRS